MRCLPYLGCCNLEVANQSLKLCHVAILPHIQRMALCSCMPLQFDFIVPRSTCAYLYPHLYMDNIKPDLAFPQLESTAVIRRRPNSTYFKSAFGPYSSAGSLPCRACSCLVFSVSDFKTFPTLYLVTCNPELNHTLRLTTTTTSLR